MENRQKGKKTEETERKQIIKWKFKAKHINTGINCQWPTHTN